MWRLEPHVNLCQLSVIGLVAIKLFIGVAVTDVVMRQVS